MKKRTIRQAAIEVLKRRGKPLSAKEIYSVIVEEDLYRFNAERPDNIVQVEIRRHCVGLDFPTARSDKYFQILVDGTYLVKGCTY
jgi:restriction system protein